MISIVFIFFSFMKPCESLLGVPYIVRRIIPTKNVIKNVLPIKSEKNITLSNYLGLWNQVATSRSTKLFGTGPSFTNVMAYYELLNTTNISVYNSGYKENKKFTSISGYSYVTGKSQTKRKLHFTGVPFEGNYWIVKLGPIQNNMYSYAIVSGALNSFFGTRFSLYVLARNKEEYKLKYEKTVKKWCKQNNFIYFWNKYIPTYKKQEERRSQTSLMILEKLKRICVYLGITKTECLNYRQK